jgi:hypothetical protein
MISVQSTEAYIACADVLHRFYRALDTGDYQSLANLMLADGVWERQGKRLEGRGAIMEALNDRSPGLITAHLVSNLVVDCIDGRTAIASAYITVLRHEGDGSSVGPVPVPAPRAVQFCRDRLMLTEDGWRIAEKTSKAIFRSNH